MIFIHSKIKKLISAYLDCEVSEKEKNLVEEHLKKCTFCRKYYESLQKLSSTLDKYKGEELSPDLEQRIKNNFLGEKYKGVAKMKNKKLVVGISSGALAILVMFVFVGHMYNYLKHSEKGKFQDASGTISDRSSNFGSSVQGRHRNATDKIGEQYSPGLGSAITNNISNMQDSRREIKSGKDEAWITTTDNSTAAWDEGYSARSYDYEAEKKVPSMPSITNTEEGPIVIVEPYLPATGKEDKLIRSADATLEVENIQKVYDEIVKIGKGKNGYLAAANFNESASGRISAKIILRVPKEKFDETIDAIRKLGQVKRFDINSIDVSQNYNALVAEINTVKTVYDKIAEKLKEKKTDIQASIRLESQLTPIAKRIEALRNKIAEYDNLISVSTITINLYEVSWKLMIQESLKETKQHFVEFVSSLLRNSVKLLPLLIIVGVVTAVCMVVAAKLLRLIKDIFGKKSS